MKRGADEKQMMVVDSEGQGKRERERSACGEVGADGREKRDCTRFIFLFL